MTLKVRWVGSPNYFPGRLGHNPNWTAADTHSWIVLHTMVGSLASATARFRSPTGGASSTYGIGLDGSIVQFVKETDGPWTNGVNAGVGSNLDSITIEHEDGGNYNGPRTPALYEASAQLVADISRRRGIPLVHRGNGGGVIRHKECTGASTACPDSLDIDRILARANAILHPPPPPPPPPVDTRPEWQRNLKPAVGHFTLSKAVPIIQMATGVALAEVEPGPVDVAFQTSTGGVDFWVTTFGSTAGNGLRKSDVSSALAPTPIVTPDPPPEPVPAPPVIVPDPAPEAPPGGWAAFIAWIKRVLGLS